MLVCYRLLHRTDGDRAIHRHLDFWGGEAEHEDLGGDVAGDAEVDAVSHGGVADEVLGVGLEHVEAVDDDAGLEQAGAVRGLLEPGDGRHPERHPVVHDVERRGPVPDADLVGVHGGEEEGDVEGEVGGGRDRGGRRRGRGRRGDEEVLDGDLVEVELGLAGLDREDDHERDGEGEEGQEDDEHEDAAAAAAEGGRRAVRGRGSPVVRAALRVGVGAVAVVVAVGLGRHGGRGGGVGWVGW